MIQIPLSPSATIAGRYANRHGLITGPTGTGKSVTLQTLAEGFSRAGVPVFVTDAKGDLSGIAVAGTGPANPVRFWDAFGEAGSAARLTVEAVGAETMARTLSLTDIQAGCLEVAFAFAESDGLKLQTLEDLRRVLSLISANAKAVSAQYGLVGAGSIAAIQRALLRLEKAGGNRVFGPPCFDVAALLKRDASGRGEVNLLAAEKLSRSPELYAAFVLFVLADLFERLPEVGDLDAPQLALLIDEAHLLFTDAPPALLQRIGQIVRLIRSKGVALFFVTQSPGDIPASIAAQLGNRIAHGDGLGVGWAKLTLMQPDGVPFCYGVDRISLPGCKLGPAPIETRRPCPAPRPAHSQFAPRYPSARKTGKLTLGGMALLLALISGPMIFAATALQWAWQSGALALFMAAAIGVALARR